MENGLKEKRINIWNNLLHKVNGTTYSEIEKVCCANQCFKDEACSSDTLRQDKRYIKLLLQDNLVETGRKNTHFSLKDMTINIVELHKENMSKKPYSALLELLTQLEGAFPDSFIKKLYKSFDSIERNPTKISFETDYGLLQGMDYFPDIYTAINKKHVLLVTATRFGNQSISESYLFCPEFLKQYNSIWYVFGLGRKAEERNMSLIKIDLTRITSCNTIYNELFTDSGTDYEDYFDEIIGIENYPQRQALKIELLVRNTFVKRFLNNPLHGSLRENSKVNKRGYKCFVIEVKMNKELIRKLVSYGRDVLVLSPNKVKKEVFKEIRKTYENYIINQ